MERRQFLKTVLIGAAASIIPISDSKREVSNARPDSQVETFAAKEVCNGDVDKVVKPFGSVVYRTEGMPNGNTIVTIKMIHNSKSFPQLKAQVNELQRDIFEIGKKLVGAGIKRIGGEGFDPGDVKKEELIAGGFGQTSYSFANLEIYFDEELESFGYDRKDLLQKTYQLLREGKAIEALKINPERARGMVGNVVNKVNETRDSCLAIIAGGDHMEKEGEPEIREFVDHVNFMQLFEEKGFNVIVVEPRTYQFLSEQVKKLKFVD